jgi:hypothetical protein
MLERISSDMNRMPPVPNAPLSAADRELLSAWVSGGALPSDELCRADAPEQRDARFIAPFPDPSECEVPLELRAGADADGNPFEVPPEDDRYECFYIKAPDEPILSLGFEPILDDTRVVHHWLLYQTNDPGLVDRTHASCTGVHPDATLLAGWAPGGLAYGMPAGVGQQLPSGEDGFFILEIHYNNLARYADARDRSGVKVCGTRKPQPNIAAVHWLGTENILLLPGESSAGSTCNPGATEPVHILSITPHMHQLGAHSRVVMNRSDGTQQVLLDEPFDFNTQVGYDTPAVLMPGESLTSTCSWNNTTGGLTTFGESTSDEMCYLFTLAYPAGAFDTGGDFLFAGFLGGDNKCMR